MPRFSVALATILAAVPALAAAPAISGLYRAGELGIVDIQTLEGRIVARYRGAGSCNFKQDIQVLSGNFEGDVFLGTVFVCQEGPSCEREKTFPFLAVFHEGALAGDVKLDVGCSSPGLEGRRLNVSVATQEDRLLVLRDNDTSAASIAGKNANRKELERMAAESYTLAQLKLKEENFAAARTALERSITYDDANWKTWFFLSQVELKLNNVAKALQSIEKAVLVAPKAKQHITDDEMGELFYNLACAQSRNGKKVEAVKSLKNSFRVGDVTLLVQSAQADTDLDPLREEPEFKRVLADAKNRKDKPKGPR
jgi:tetratricopeptide (TPR) repeat protein